MAQNLANKYPPLTPNTSPWMDQVMANKSLLRELFNRHGSPINLHNIQPFLQNYEAYHELLDSFGLRHQIYFARKANVCQAFAGAACRHGFGVDTASFNELDQCLQLGCEPGQLVVTAAVKKNRLVQLAVRHGVLIILDNAEECARLNEAGRKYQKEVPVGVRLSGFVMEDQHLYSRFGFDIADAVHFITTILPQFSNLRFQGFHFHLDGYSIKQRAEALRQTIRKADVLEEHGISTSFIDMGGGLLVNYLSSKQEWVHFWSELRKAVRDERSPLTFGNHGLGYAYDGDDLRGEPDVYPYYNEIPKTQFLEAVLRKGEQNGQALFSLLGDRDIELRMEPGRSLVDQAGMTLAKVAHRKKDRHGDWLVGLEMNRSQLFSSSADFLVDPQLITMESSSQTSPVAVYFTGAYCLEADIILKRKIVLPQLPQIGDIIAFPNTAGYLMHFYETRSHLLESAVNLVADGNCFIPDRVWVDKTKIFES